VVEWGGPVGCALDVTGTWRYLADRARAAGATVETGTLVRPNGTARLTLRHGEHTRPVRCRLAIDATGTPSLLARSAGVHQGFRRVGVGYERELSAPGFPQHEAMILVGGIAPAGYAWAFPRGETRVRVGVGVIQPDVSANPRELYAPLEHELADELRGSQLLELHTGRIPSQEAPARLTGDALMVVGDSGAHSNPLLGEGIRHVIRAARRAAPIAAAALAKPGVVPRERLRSWERAGRRTRGSSWGLTMRANRYVAAMDDGDWDRAVTMIGRLPAELVTPLLRGDVLTAAFARGLAQGGPQAAWRVMRPFVV
jgi:digeranylgeranylglycerophospholipid reductase